MEPLVACAHDDEKVGTQGYEILPVVVLLPVLESIPIKGLLHYQ